MARMRLSVYTLGLSAALLGMSMSFSGCAASGKPYEPKKARTVFYFPSRQHAPEPVYNRLREVRVPDPLPSGYFGAETAPIIHPVFHMKVKDVTLEKAAQLLASTARYNSFCAGTIADRKISINDLGNIDELGRKIARKADIHVVVDHENAQVRFLAHEVVSPKLYDEGLK